jgi:hypothetical protein
MASMIDVDWGVRTANAFRHRRVGHQAAADGFAPQSPA